MTIEQLSAILKAPVKHDSVDSAVWNEVETDLGMTLPSDYREFCERYGPGAIVDRGRLRVDIFNPLAPMYRQQIDRSCYVVQSHKESEWGKDIRYDIYPNTPGLFPFGHDDNGNRLFWFTEGAADNWPIVVYEHDGPGGIDDFQQFDIPMVTFLAKVLKHEIACRIWPDPFFTDLANVEYARTVTT